jgi:hypothetical protein
MKNVVCAFTLFCLAAAGALGQSTPPQKTYRIAGVVVNGATGQRVSRVRVLMTPAGESSKETEITTGSDGRFAFEGLKAGMWTLHAERKGFVRQGYCERPGVPNSLTQVVTGPGEATENLTFRLDAPATVSGKITDETGEPVIAGVQVIIQLETGTRQFQRIKDAATDEQGEYRIWDLPAVPCYLLVMTPASPFAPGDAAPATFAPQYYGNTADPRTATLLDLKPGEEYKADFILRRSRGASIHITGETATAGVMLVGEGPGGADVVVSQLDTPIGSFHNIAPGRYKVILYDMQSGAQSSKRIQVAGEDVTVTAPFPNPPAVTVNARLVNGDASLLPNVTFYLHADGDYQTYARRVGPEGKVTIPGMPGGRYRFMLATGGLYMKSVTSGNARVVDCWVDVPETGEVKLDVVLAGDGGEVAGKVRDNGKPAFPVRVVLAPKVDSTNSVDYKSYQTESDGSFRFPSIKPGEYILYTTSDWKLEFGNPEAIRKYLKAGHPVHVAPKSSIDVQIESTRP